MPQNSTSADAEWDELTSALNAQGIRHVAPGRDVTASRGVRPLQGQALIRRLLASPDVRLQEASVLLLLTQPSLAAGYRTEIKRLSGDAQRRAMHRYVAAAALQRMWRTRIALDLGPQSMIPAAYLRELELPPLEWEFGRPTLLALCEQADSHWGYDAWAGYTSLIDLFLTEISIEGWGEVHARAG